MPFFEVGKEFTTREPRIIVDAGLPPGRYRFRLVVVNGAGQRSRPTDLVVTIVRQQPVQPGSGFVLTDRTRVDPTAPVSPIHLPTQPR